MALSDSMSLLTLQSSVQTPAGMMSSVHITCDPTNPQHEIVQYFEWNAKSLAPYHKYPELKEERKVFVPHVRQLYSPSSRLC